MHSYDYPKAQRLKHVRTQPTGLTGEPFTTVTIDVVDADSYDKLLTISRDLARRMEMFEREVAALRREILLHEEKADLMRQLIEAEQALAGTHLVGLRKAEDQLAQLEDYVGRTGTCDQTAPESRCAVADEEVAEAPALSGLATLRAGQQFRLGAGVPSVSMQVCAGRTCVEIPDYFRDDQTSDGFTPTTGGLRDRFEQAYINAYQAGSARWTLEELVGMRLGNGYGSRDYLNGCWYGWQLAHGV